MIRRSGLLLIAVSLALSCGRASDPLQVSTRLGTVRGVEEDGVRVFRGIPYAAPPVGDLRWRPPQEASPWEGVRDAAAFGPVCSQRLPANDTRTSSEDCLTLNVWTPAPNGSALPVMVWVHGGGFSTGSGSETGYSGLQLARDGVVLVTFNYRLGALGFFAHPLLDAEHPEEPHGDYGVLDMVAALRWVRDNIQGFGGDSSKVTVFGESAGGMAVDLLMVSPPARGLFQRAIAQSGYPTWPLPRTASAPARPGGASAEAVGEEIVARATPAGPPASVAELRALPAEALVSAVAALHMPLVDGEVVPDEPGILFARGEQQAVPFITGGDSYDGAVMAMAGLDPAAFLETLGDDQREARRLYADDFAKSDELGASRLFGDNRYLVGARYLAGQMAARGAPAYLYLFGYVPEERRDQWPGAPHASELGLLFGTAPAPPGSSAAEVGATLREAWVRFAASGDPNGGALPFWPAYRRDQDVWMVFDEVPSATEGVLAPKLDFLEARYLARVAAHS